MSLWTRAGHTLSWLLLELCRKPELQLRLQAEIDVFVAKHNGDLQSIEYNDFAELPFLTRCITETLRLWPAVANGTFRTLQFDDYCVGPDGKEVPLAKGTHVQINSWCRHRSKELWGDDVNEFNPDRDFAPTELWGGTFAAYNPSTSRFSPFTYAPRSCVGMNFAQMEMRAILINCLSICSFELGTASATTETLSMNRGTLAPSDVGAPLCGMLVCALVASPSAGSRMCCWVPTKPRARSRCVRRAHAHARARAHC